jgi:hypothetical protein
MYRHSQCERVDDLRFRDVTDITELAPGRNNEVIRSELCSAIAFRRVAIRSGFLRCWCLAALAALMPPWR